MESELYSYHLVGRFEPPDTRVHIIPLKIGVAPEVLDEDDVIVFKHLCRQAGAIAVCTIRARKEFNDEVVYYHSFFSENPSPEDELAKANALLRIVAAERNPNDPEGEAQAIASEARTLAQLGFGGE